MTVIYRDRIYVYLWNCLIKQTIHIFPVDFVTVASKTAIGIALKSDFASIKILVNVKTV